MELKVDDERANEISMRVAAATKGPWTSTALTEDDDTPVDRVYDDKGRLVCQMWPNEGAFSAFERSQYDGLFTAHARQDVPDLLADRATLLAKVREMEAVVERLMKTKDGAPVVPGDTVYLMHRDVLQGMRVKAQGYWADERCCSYHVGATTYNVRIADAYSTEQAARAAALAGAGRDGAGEGR